MTADTSAQAGDYDLEITADVGGHSFDKTVTVTVKTPDTLEITYPLGESPKVFSRGRTFGASCILNP